MLTTSESDSGSLGRNPVGQSGTTSVVPEANHAGDSSPPVLAQPAIGTAGTRASTDATVGSTRISVSEAAITGEDGGSSVRVSKGEDHGEGVCIVGRVVVEGCTVLCMRPRS